jgi:hypothetical protein
MAAIVAKTVTFTWTLRYHCGTVYGGAVYGVPSISRPVPPGAKTTPPTTKTTTNQTLGFDNDTDCL